MIPGADATGIAVFGWVEMEISSWTEVLRGWLDWRHQLYRTIGIPADYELHATKFVGGRGHPTGTSWYEIKSRRAPVVAEALQTIAGLPGLQTGAAFQHTTAGVKYPQTKKQAYAELVRKLDARLTAAGEHGLIMMDGDGTDPTYRVAHRDLKLDTGSLIEDPLFQGAHHSQWVQMTDLVAYAAYMHLGRIPTKEHTWGWFRDIVATAATTGPTPLDLAQPQ